MKNKLYKELTLTLSMKNKEFKKKEVKKKVYYGYCKYCNKYFESEHLNQMHYNFDAHETSCNDNPKKKKI